MTTIKASEEESKKIDSLELRFRKIHVGNSPAIVASALSSSLALLFISEGIGKDDALSQSNKLIGHYLDVWKEIVNSNTH